MLNPGKTKYYLFRFIAGIFLVGVITICVGVLAHKSLSSLVTTISNEAQPNKKLILVKEIQFELTDLESIIRTYTLTGDDYLLEPFYNILSDIKTKVKDLRHLSQNNPIQQYRIDSISVLVEKKVGILHELIHLKEDDVSITRLGELQNKIDKKKQTAETTTEVTPEVNNKSKKSFKNLFRKKNKADTIDQKLVADPVTSQNEFMENISNEIETIRSEEIYSNEQQKFLELSIINRDREIVTALRALMLRIEKDEIIAAQITAHQAAVNGERTTNVIFILCGLTVVVLIISSALIVSYVKSNNRYKKFLREARDQAERHASVKKEFLANMSHEIRTPINAVMGFTEQLGNTPLDDVQKKYVHIIHNSTEHLLSLINSILDHSRLESGKMVFNKIPFNIREMIDQISEMFMPLVLEKKLSMRAELEPITSEWITGDPDRLRQVLINLIGNSVKFTNAGRISLKILRNETNGLLVEVADEGIGIARDRLKQIFESFKQADTYTTRKFGGTGLGLTICKQIIEQQNGWIIVESEPGLGSVFRFFLPYPPSKEPLLIQPLQVAEKENKPSSKQLAGVKIFGADDELYNRNLLEAILAKTGCLFESVEDGDMASSYLDKKKYDIILLDVRMPGKSGTEVAHLVRTNKAHINNATPIVALTAGVSKDELEECQKAGINFIIAKPFTETELFSVLGNLLNEKMNKQSNIKNKSMNDLNGKSFTLEELMMIANGDVAFVKQMISIFISSTQENIRQIEMAVQEDDVPAIGNIAHKMAAPCRHLGMQDLASLLKVIERKAFERTPINILEPYVKDAVKQARHNMEELRDTYDKLPLTHNISSQ